MNIIAKFTKLGYIKYLGHLDQIALMEKAFKRAGLDLTYSQGYNPQPILSIANPLPLGVESQCEYLQMETVGEEDLDLIKDKINDQLPKGMDIIAIKAQPRIQLEKTIRQVSYRLYLPDYVDMEALVQAIDTIAGSETYIVMRDKKRKGKTYQIPFDLVNFLLDFQVNEEDRSLDYLSKSVSGGHLSFRILLEALAREGVRIDPDQVRVIRTSQMDREGREII